MPSFSYRRIWTTSLVETKANGILRKRVRKPIPQKRSSIKLINFIVQKGRASGFFLFEEAANRYPDAECIWSRSGVYNWRETYERVCQYGNYFRSLGVQPGEFVGVYLLNSPEVIFSWMGLLSIGAAPALINYNLASDALIHCIGLSGTKILLSDGDEGCQSRVQGSREQIANNLGVNMITLSEELKAEIANIEPTRSANLDWASSPTLPLGLLYTR